MSEPIQAYPLTWPNRPRTRWPEASNFRVTLGQAIKEVQREVNLLGGTSLIISSNLPVKRDGMPYANSSQPQDRGVAVYFTYKKRPMCFACDRWKLVEENMRAIAKTIDALRGIARWGTGDMIQQAFTGFAALPAPESWWQVLRLSGPNASAAEIRSAHRRLISEHHPDNGGDTDMAAKINRARDQGMEAQ